MSPSRPHLLIVLLARADFVSDLADGPEVDCVVTSLEVGRLPAPSLTLPPGRRDADERGQNSRELYRSLSGLPHRPGGMGHRKQGVQQRDKGDTVTMVSSRRLWRCRAARAVGLVAGPSTW